jgi:hypothetical protein
MQIHIHHYDHYDHEQSMTVDLKKVFSLLNQIKIDMATAADITTAVTVLTQHIAEAEARIKAKEDAEVATIEALKAQIAKGGATPEELQTILDGVIAADKSVQGIDAPPVVVPPVVAPTISA